MRWCYAAAGGTFFFFFFFLRLIISIMIDYIARRRRHVVLRSQRANGGTSSACLPMRWQTFIAEGEVLQWRLWRKATPLVEAGGGVKSLQRTDVVARSAYREQKQRRTCRSCYRAGTSPQTMRYSAPRPLCAQSHPKRREVIQNYGNRQCVCQGQARRVVAFQRPPPVWRES